MSETMIERVAKALFAAGDDWIHSEPPGDGWPKLSSVWQDGYRKSARAAMEAMRDPTEAMVNSGGNGEAAIWGRGCWSNYIDAALSEAKDPPPAYCESDCYCALAGIAPFRECVAAMLRAENERELAGHARVMTEIPDDIRLLSDLIARRHEERQFCVGDKTAAAIAHDVALALVEERRRASSRVGPLERKAKAYLNGANFATDDVARLEAELERLRKALEPFAREAEAISKAHLDGHCTDLDMRPVAVGHLRAASKALGPHSGGSA